MHTNDRDDRSSKNIHCVVVRILISAVKRNSQNFNFNFLEKEIQN